MPVSFFPLDRGGSNGLIQESEIRCKEKTAKKVGSQKRRFDAFYDIESDTLELRNLIVSPISLEKNREKAMEMKEHLVSWME